MLRFLPVVLMLLFPFAVGAEEPKSVKFTSEEGKFTVTVPSKPVEKSNTVKTAAGDVKVHLFIIDLKDRAYIVSYNDYPAGMLDPDAQKVIGRVIEGNLKSNKGKVASDEKITVGKKKYPGRNVQITLPDKKGVYRARIILVGDRLYQIVAQGPEAFIKSKSVEEYFKSFTLEE